jgi:outer membrane protein, heavy metal efflux system
MTPKTLRETLLCFTSTILEGFLQASILFALSAPAMVRSEEPRTSLTWERMRELTQQGNPDIQLARQAIEAAQADLERAGLRPNPTLTLSDSSWKYNRSPLGFGADISARIDQTLERGGKLKLRQKQSTALLESIQLDLLRAERQVMARLASAIVDLDSARLKLEASKDISATLDRAAAIARKRLNAGDLSEVAADRVSTDAIRALNDITVAQGDLLDAELALKLLVGSDKLSGQNLQSIDVSSMPAPPSAERLVGSDGSTVKVDPRTPELMAAKRREAAAQAGVELAQSQRTRDVSLGVQVEKQPFTGGPFLGLSLSVPLLIFNDYSADIRRASSDQTSAELDTRRLEAQVQADQARLRHALRIATERENRLRDQALPVAVRNAKAVEFSFQRGAASVLEVLDAERTLRSVQIEVISARADRLRSATAVALILDPGLLGQEVPTP